MGLHKGCLPGDVPIAGKDISGISNWRMPKHETDGNMDVYKMEVFEV
jgi:hypothetical protein